MAEVFFLHFSTILQQFITTRFIAIFLKNTFEENYFKI
jgi:hypothetical protein